MRIITLCRLTENGEAIDTNDTNAPDPRDWWCVIETKEEEMLYDRVHGTYYNYSDHDYQLMKALLEDMVKHAGQGMGLCWGDDDIYGYIRPDEVYPEVGEEFVDSDDDKWVRVE